MNQKWGKRLSLSVALAMSLSVLPTSAFADNETAPSSSSSPALSDTAAGGDNSTVIDDKSVKLTKSKAEQLVRQYVNIPKDYTVQSTGLSSVSLAEGKRQYWNIEFVKRVNGKHMGSINASIDANSGQLIEFNSYVNNPSVKPTYPLKVDRDAAKKLADDFIKQIAADYSSEVRFNEQYGKEVLPPLTGQVRHMLRYDRIVNGIAFADNNISIEVDSEGHVQRFSLNWDSTVKFPKIGNYLNEQEARQKIEQAASPILKYVLPYDNNDGKPILIEDLQAFAIDAVTGKKNTSADRYTFYQGTPSTSPITDKPLASAPLKKEISEKDAVAAVEKAFKLPDGAELQHSSYYEHQNDRVKQTFKQWHLNWAVKEKDKEIGSFSASVDASTGTVVNYYGYYYNSSTSANTGTQLTLDEAVAKAEQTVKEQLPWLTHQLYVVKPDPKQFEKQKPEDNFTYYINFVRKVHGAIVEYDNVGVAIESKTGKVTSFDGSITPIEYAAKTPDLISGKQSLERWLDYYNIQLTYRLVQQYWLNGLPMPIEKYKVMLASGVIQDDVEVKNEVELVYQLVPRTLNESVWLNAVTGEWITRDKGEVTQLDLPKATDIAGHWAEPQLELMISYKALDVKEGLVQPNKEVTRGELIKMLVLARNRGEGVYMTAQSSKLLSGGSFNDVAADSAYFAYVESALEQNLIDVGDGSFNPEGTVSREDMAELIVRALGYNTLAQRENIFKAEFKDADKIDKKGQVAIVVGLNIMSLSNESFRPDKKVTRAEAAAAFFRYLQQRAELQEAPIRM